MLKKDFAIYNSFESAPDQVWFAKDCHFSPYHRRTVATSQLKQNSWREEVHVPKPASLVLHATCCYLRRCPARYFSARSYLGTIRQQNKPKSFQIILLQFVVSCNRSECLHILLGYPLVCHPWHPHQWHIDCPAHTGPPLHVPAAQLIHEDDQTRPYRSGMFSITN